MHKISKYGWIPDLPDHRDHRFSTTHPPVLGMTLPAHISLRSGCPPVYDQGQLGSCTSNALAAAVDFERHRQKEPFITPSRLFIYYNERAIEGTIDSDSGASLRDGIKSLASQGVCPESEWPYSDSDDRFEIHPSPKCYSDALKFEALKYLSLDNSNVTQLKQSLFLGYPFVCGFSVYSSFESDQVAATGVVPLPSPAERQIGGHAVLCVGYTDPVPHVSQGRFLCRNSWGTGWGQGGYFTIPYLYLTNQDLADDFWVIQLVK